MIEYAALIAICAAAIVGMAVYFKRAVCGKYKEAADIFSDGKQFEPGVTRDQNGAMVQ